MNEELAVPRPVVPPSDAEREACERMASISIEGCEEKAKAAKLKATLMFDKPKPISVPEFVTRQNQAEREKLEAQIEALQKRSESA
jgi:hypothetical protein